MTGTAKQHVVFDYLARSAASMAALQALHADSLSRLVGLSHWAPCPLLNVSLCAPTQALNATSGPLTMLVQHLCAEGVGVERVEEGAHEWRERDRRRR